MLLLPINYGFLCALCARASPGVHPKIQKQLTSNKKREKHIIRRLNRSIFQLEVCFCERHEVRILKLENTTQNRTIVSAMIDSADIWEQPGREWEGLKIFVFVCICWYRSRVFYGMSLLFVKGVHSFPWA